MTEASWLSDLARWLEQADHGGVVMVCFPTYRPELAMALADSLGFAYHDFRKEHLAPLGWQATRIPLDSIVDVAAQAMDCGRGVVLQNIEALLAAHDAPTRRRWFGELIARTWPRRLLLPIVLYRGDLPRSPEHVYEVPQADLPEESLLLRLSSLR